MQDCRPRRSTATWAGSSKAPTASILRKFVDTNDDNIVDQWSYYKDGLEVYRDIDSNFNGKADQYRWFHTGGSRWGVDTNEDGSDRLLEVDLGRRGYGRSGCGAGHARRRPFRAAGAYAGRVEVAGTGQIACGGRGREDQQGRHRLQSHVGRQKAVGADAVWMQFSASRPGVVPAGTDGSTKDLRVYENVVAIAESGGKHVQVQIGTLVQVGDAWRVIDMPQPVGDGQADATSTGFFFQASMTRRSESANGGRSEAVQKLLADLEGLDREAGKATTPEEQAGRSAAGPSCWSRSPQPPKRLRNAACGCGNWPT